MVLIANSIAIYINTVIVDGNFVFITITWVNRIVVVVVIAVVISTIRDHVRIIIDIIITWITTCIIITWIKFSNIV